MMELQHQRLMALAGQLQLESLTAKQLWVYENELKPMSVEKCGFQGTCERPAFPGKYCDRHEQESGS